MKNSFYLLPLRALSVLLLVLQLLPSLLFAQSPAVQSADTVADNTHSANVLYMQLRGLEREGTDGKGALRATANALLFVPRTIVDGLLYSTGYGAHLIDDSKFVERVDDFFYLYGRQVGWYPAIDFSLGSASAFGATLFYRREGIGVSAGGTYGNSDLWSVRTNLIRQFLFAGKSWRLNLQGKMRKRNDYEFYGFGANPRRDARNVFRAGKEGESGVYTQQLSRLHLVLGVRPANDWEVFYTSYIQQRRITNSPDDKDNLAAVFEATSIPGFVADAETDDRQFYNELAVRFDTRKYRGQISPGIRLEGYSGFSAGLKSSDANFLRSGIDAALYLPLIRKTRLLVPRVVWDVTSNQSDNRAIVFTDYARQPAFRGASRRTLLRTDEISLLPSLEYQWPLAFNLRGHLFADYLLVAPSLSQLTFADAPYAFGFAIDVHSLDSESARFSVSSGSEGLRVLFTVGLAAHSSDRTKWQ